jgi:hypothetical protein
MLAGWLAGYAVWSSVLVDWLYWQARNPCRLDTLPGGICWLACNAGCLAGSAGLLCRLTCIFWLTNLSMLAPYAALLCFLYLLFTNIYYAGWQSMLAMLVELLC